MTSFFTKSHGNFQKANGKSSRPDALSPVRPIRASTSSSSKKGFSSLMVSSPYNLSNAISSILGLPLSQKASLKGLDHPFLDVSLLGEQRPIYLNFGQIAPSSMGIRHTMKKNWYFPPSFFLIGLFFSF